jgi:hypothetical protein
MSDAPSVRDAVRLMMIVPLACLPLFAFVSHPSADGWPIVAIVITVLLLGDVLSRLFTRK